MCPENVFASSVRVLVEEVLAQQGFIVIGFKSTMVTRKKAARLPWHTAVLFQYDMRRPYEVYHLATQLDWEVQNALIKNLRPSWIEVPENRGMLYFKVRPL